MASLITNRNTVPDEWALLQSASGPDAFSALRGRKVLLPLELILSDGRPFSLARRLRMDLGFTGEIRAIGDVLRDQLCFLERCGFNSFALRSDQDVDECLSAFDDFSSTYTATALNQEPIFRRR
jgi:hypothetical protein